MAGKKKKKGGWGLLPPIYFPVRTLFRRRGQGEDVERWRLKKRSKVLHGGAIGFAIGFMCEGWGWGGGGAGEGEWRCGRRSLLPSLWEPVRLLGGSPHSGTRTRLFIWKGTPALSTSHPLHCLISHGEDFEIVIWGTFKHTHLFRPLAPAITLLLSGRRRHFGSLTASFWVFSEVTKQVTDTSCVIKKTKQLSYNVNQLRCVSKATALIQFCSFYSWQSSARTGLDLWDHV